MRAELHESGADYETEYQQVRAALVARGSSLNRWLHERGISRQLAYQALKERSFGRKAITVRTMILRDVLGDR